MPAYISDKWCSGPTRRHARRGRLVTDNHDTVEHELDTRGSEEDHHPWRDCTGRGRERVEAARARGDDLTGSGGLVKMTTATVMFDASCMLAAFAHLPRTGHGASEHRHRVHQGESRGLPRRVLLARVPRARHTATSQRGLVGYQASANMARDVDTDNILESAGWRVLRFWEHEVPEPVADRIFSVVRTPD